MARKGRTEGTVVIRGTILRSGSLRECTVSRSSGSSLLDNAAVWAVRSVSQFPPMPLELQGDDLVFDLPISFRLSAE
jgi:protein TonB